MSAEADPLFFTHHVFCCTNRREPGHRRGCCAEKGADSLRDYMKHKVKDAGLKGVRVNNAGCLDRCELGPVMVIYPEGIWYRCPDKAAIDEVVERHLKGGEVVERLRLTNSQS